MSAKGDNELARHLVHVLARLDGLTLQPTRCCDDCGCLLRRGETCPNCALATVRPVTDLTTHLATRRAV